MGVLTWVLTVISIFFFWLFLKDFCFVLFISALVVLSTTYGVNWIALYHPDDCPFNFLCHLGNCHE